MFLCIVSEASVGAVTGPSQTGERGTGAPAMGRHCCSQQANLKWLEISLGHGEINLGNQEEN